MLFLPVVAELAGEAALKSMPNNVGVEHIDASWIGMLVGGVTTGLAVAVLFLFIGWLLVKYGAVKIGTPVPIAVIPSNSEGKESHHYVIAPEVCVDCAAQKLLSSQHETQISELFNKWNSVKESIGTMAVDLGVIKADVGNIQKGIADLQTRRGGK